MQPHFLQHDVLEISIHKNKRIGSSLMFTAGAAPETTIINDFDGMNIKHEKVALACEARGRKRRCYFLSRDHAAGCVNTLSNRASRLHRCAVKSVQNSWMWE